MAKRKPADPNAARDALLQEIAERHLFLETLETRNRDRLDFHETAVWAIRAALEEAFEAGRRAGGAAVDLTCSAMPASLNCLPEGETLADLIRRECAIGFDLRFCRSVAASEHDRDTITCDPPEADFAGVYALTDLGEAIAIHDADLTSAGADEVAAVARALFVAIVNSRRDSPDAAQRHEAQQATLTDHHWIE